MYTEPASGEITRLLVAFARGDRGAMDRLFPLVYTELRGIAARRLRRSGACHTLNPTGLIHEAYLRLAECRSATIEDRAHFFAIAALAMRQILVDHARRRAARKRGGDLTVTMLTESALAIDARAAEIVAVDRALARLATLDTRLVQVVELRFFGGLTVEETAAALGVTSRTVKRDWRKARAFLFRELTRAPLGAKSSEGSA